ncbi:hypothetical protein D9M72_567300 [compost metagenome]
MQEDDVDHVGSQLPQGLVHAAGNRGSAPVLRAVDVVSHFRGQHHGVAPAGQPRADPLFGEPVAARCVDERDAQIHGSVEEAVRFPLTDVVIANMAGAESEGGHGQGRVSEVPLQHALDSSRPGAVVAL